MNSFGRKFRVEIYGESHGPEVGVIIDGVPPGIPLETEDFIKDIGRRKSGRAGTTARCETDLPEIRSGLFEGRSTGSPLLISFKNENALSLDYKEMKDMPRPGHADFTANRKFKGFNDFRGGGHFSGRITVGLVAAGVVAKKIVKGMVFLTKIIRVGNETDPDKIEKLLNRTIKDGNSLGALVECRIQNTAIGLGEPFFDSTESVISHLVFSIPGVRGIEFGSGFQAPFMKGSEHNDQILSTSGKTRTNHQAGINGGITNGNEIVFRVAFKPTPSISQPQQTINMRTNKVESIQISGRHDTCFALRTSVIVESAAAIALADLNLIQN